MTRLPQPDQTAAHAETVAAVEPDGATSDIATSGIEAMLRDYEPEDFRAEVAETRRRLKAVVDPNAFRPNDRGNKEMFIDYWCKDYRGMEGHAKHWVHWNVGTNRYEKLEVGKIYEACQPAVEDRLERAAERAKAAANDDASRKAADKLVTRALNAGNKRTMDSYLSLVREANSVLPSAFDQESLVLGVANGVIDLRAGEDGVHPKPRDVLRPATQDDLIFDNTRVSYDPDADSPWVAQTLDYFLPDPAFRRDVLRVIGSSLQRGNPDRLIIFIMGGSSTGKSTFLDLLKRALGDYAKTASPHAFTEKSSGSKPQPELLDVLFARVALLSESSSRVAMHADLLKRISGNSDQIAARQMYSGLIVSSNPFFTPIIATNATPSVPDVDPAFKRRMLVLPFDREIEKSAEKAHTLTDTDCQHFLRLLVEGWLEYLEYGIAGPEGMHQTILDSTAEAHTQLSFFQDWVHRAFRRIDKGATPRTGRRVTLAKAMEMYFMAEDAGHIPANQRINGNVDFASKMRDEFGPMHKNPFKLAGTNKSHKRYNGIEWKTGGIGL